MNKGSSLGGIVRAKQQHDEALRIYYAHPNRCRYCNEVMRIGEGQKIQQVRRKKFCNHSCSAAFTNKVHPKRKAVVEGKCGRCGRSIVFGRRPSGGISSVRFCKDCRGMAKLESKGYETLIGDRTKGDIRRRHKTYTGFRNAIARHARVSYMSLRLPMVCRVCGYSKWVDICHIRSVASFDDSVTIKEINSSKNLMGLCKNHHWEYDHGLLDKPGVA